MPLACGINLNISILLLPCAEGTFLLFDVQLFMGADATNRGRARMARVPHHLKKVINCLNIKLSKQKREIPKDFPLLL